MCVLKKNVVSSLLMLIFLTSARTSSNDANVQRNIFAADIYGAIGLDNLNDNVVISPMSVQCSMALAYYGAKGATANELQSALRLSSDNAEDIVQRFGEFQKEITKDNNIRLFNNIYINENLEFKGKFREVAQRNFDSNVEKADFHPPYNKRTADRINKLVDTKTNGRIKDLLPAQDLNDFTQGVIINALAYMATPWQKSFPLDKTNKRAFNTGGRTSFQVDTMWTLNNFKYGEVSSLDAKVIELPYQNSEYAMLVLLPNKDDGLRTLIQNLSGKNVLALIENSMSNQKVEVYLPKFSMVFGINLAEPLKKLGVSKMFTRDGDFGNLYRMFVTHYINSAHHKAYFEISEAGIEKPLETGGLKNLFSRTKKFDANHPFVFLIKHRESIVLMGHLANYAFV